MSAPIRVLVVDDSAFARKVIREALSAEPDLEVVDHARDGLEALEKIDRLQPDVVTLDLMMPHLDGLGVLRVLAGRGPRVVVVSISPAESEPGAEALSLGAVELVEKPTALATGRLHEIALPLVRAVRAAYEARPERLPPLPVVSAAPSADAAVASQATMSQGTVSQGTVSQGTVSRETRFRLLCIGTSTGGPPALTHLLAALPAALPVPVAIVLHIPPGYSDAIARRLDALSALHVVEAREGLVLSPGMAVLAPGGTHLNVVRRGEALVVKLDTQPADRVHRPSVDVLFESAVQAAGADVLGVVLTGMGDDGLAGAQTIHAAGGKVLTESRSTCVVYGMPRSVKDAGLSDAEAPLDGMAQEILATLGGRPTAAG